MNVFLVSPGRTGTTTFSEAFSIIEGYTSAHETRVNELGVSRVSYPENHIECDNRLAFFMVRLTEKYKDSGVLVKLYRDEESIARSYNHRWRRIYIMKAYSQGILLRDLSDNNLDVCRDYVSYSYEQLNYFSSQWKHYVEIDLLAPRAGVEKLLSIIGEEKYLDAICGYLEKTRSNKNRSLWREKISALKFNIRCLMLDFK
jgi:hypothetical protein